MSFVTPGLLVAGLIAIAVPIIIHLLSRRRRQPVRWAAMRFLLEAFRRHRRRLQVEQLILLAIRCLVLALLGAALARPLLERAGLLPADGSRVVFLVIDDGLASAATDDADASALQGHVDAAKELIASLEPGDRVAVVTTARPARALLVPASSHHAGVVDLLDDLVPAQSPSDMAAALRLVRDAIDELDVDDRRALVYLLSEFRAGSADLEAALPAALADLGDSVQLYAAPPSELAVPNVQVASIDPVRHLILPGAGDGSGQVTVRVERHGSELDREVSRLVMEGDGYHAARTIEWEPGQHEADLEFILDLPAGGSRQLAITASVDRDRQPLDNARHLVLDLRRQIPVVLIDRRSFGFEPTVDRMTAGQWVRRALDPAQDGRIDVIAVEPAAVGPADLRSVDVAILVRPDLLSASGWSQLRTFVDDGGLLVITPPADLNVHQWTEELTQSLDLPWRVELETREHATPMALAAEQPRSELLRLISSELDRMVRPVSVFRHLPIEGGAAPAQTILALEDGSPLMVSGVPQGDPESPRSQGLVVMWTTAPQLSWTTLPAQVLMVPAFQETIRQGLSLIRAGSDLRVGERPRIAESLAARTLVDESIRVPLEADARPREPLARAGVYEVLDRAEVEVGRVAVNLDPTAAVTETQSPAEVLAWLRGAGPWQVFDPADLGAAVRRAETGSALAGILLLAVLALILVETLLARWFSHAFRGGGDAVEQGLRPSIDAITGLQTGGPV